MKLIDLVKDKTENINIEYRTYYQGKDMLVGFCLWKDKKIIPLDEDTYSENDEITSYEWNSPYNLTIWYKSNWIEG